MVRALATLLVTTFLAVVSTASAAETSPTQLARTPDSLYLFGGKLTRGNLGETARFLHVIYEDNHVVGAAYSRDLVDLPGRLSLAVEIGAANRFGDGRSSLEDGLGLKSGITVLSWAPSSSVRRSLPVLASFRDHSGLKSSANWNGAVTPAHFSI